METGTLTKWTYSHLATRKALGSETVIRHFEDIPSAFKALEKGEVKRIVVPVTNYMRGNVGDTLDRMKKPGLVVMADVEIPIHHVAAVVPGTDIERIRKVFSHPQAIAQSRIFVNGFKNAAVEEAPSTAGAMKMVAERKEKGTLVIGPREAANRYGLSIIAEHVEDDPSNSTRFFVIGKRDSPRAKKPVTSILVYGYNKPELAEEILSTLWRHNLNLRHSESTEPTGKLGHHLLVDIHGSRLDDRIKKAVRALGRIAKVRVLGTYPG